MARRHGGTLGFLQAGLMSVASYERIENGTGQSKTQTLRRRRLVSGWASVSNPTLFAD